jgi:hypothetical protein
MLAVSASEAGHRVVGIKTDCLWTNEVRAPIAKLRDFASVERGTFSVSRSVPPSARPLKSDLSRDTFADRDAILEHHAHAPSRSPSVEVLTMVNERSVSEAAEILAPGGVIVEADAPGCGKTTTLAGYISHKGWKGLIATPYNALKLAINREEFPGVEARTTFDVLGLTLTDDGAVESTGTGVSDLSDIKAVVWDEAQQLSDSMLQRVFAFEAAHPDIAFFYTVDYHQLGAIDPLCRLTETEHISYYQDVLRRH